MDTIIMLISSTELMGAERIREELFRAGFRVVAIETGDVQKAFLHQRPDLIVANLSGNQAADLELCQFLHRLDDAPIVAIGSACDEVFRIGMLELMVDDFLCRPVNTRELVARIRSILRRRGTLLLAVAPSVVHSRIEVVQKGGSIRSLSIRTILKRLTHGDVSCRRYE